VMRVTMADTPSPTHKALFDAVMPTTARITAALRDLVRW
jgi:pyruvate/2-oxoglutarate/acetoin dehydrogenase E1 component